MNAAPSLLELQRAFCASLAGDGQAAIEPQPAAFQFLADGADAAARLSIYRNTSVSTLTAALRLNYPAVHKLVGDEFFEGTARIFIGKHRARSACLDDYGQGFGAFLAQFPPASSLPYLPDVAELEWAVSRALHAPEAAALDLERLSSLATDASASLRLLAHPALSLVGTDAPADAIWHAVLEGDDAAMGAIDLSDRPVYLLVERRDSSVCMQRLSKAAWRFTAALCDGASLSAALAANRDCEADRVLAEHLAAGRFRGFELCEGRIE
jgi:hypothetical protein